MQTTAKDHKTAASTQQTNTATAAGRRICSYALTEVKGVLFFDWDDAVFVPDRKAIEARKAENAKKSSPAKTSEEIVISKPSQIPFEPMPGNFIDRELTKQIFEKAELAGFAVCFVTARPKNHSSVADIRFRLNELLGVYKADRINIYGVLSTRELTYMKQLDNERISTDERALYPTHDTIKLRKREHINQKINQEYSHLDITPENFIYTDDDFNNANEIASFFEGKVRVVYYNPNNNSQHLREILAFLNNKLAQSAAVSQSSTAAATVAPMAVDTSTTSSTLSQASSFNQPQPASSQFFKSSEAPKNPTASPFTPETNTAAVDLNASASITKSNS